MQKREKLVVCLIMIFIISLTPVYSFYLVGSVDDVNKKVEVSNPINKLTGYTIKTVNVNNTNSCIGFYCNNKPIISGSSFSKEVNTFFSKARELFGFK